MGPASYHSLAGNEGETNLKSQLTDDYYTFLVNMSQMSPNEILLQLAFLAWISRQDCAEEDKFSFKHPIFIATFIKQVQTSWWMIYRSNSSQDCTITTSKPRLISSSTIKGTACSDPVYLKAVVMMVMSHDNCQWLVKFLRGWSAPPLLFSCSSFC